MAGSSGIAPAWVESVNFRGSDQTEGALPASTLTAGIDPEPISTLLADHAPDEAHHHEKAREHGDESDAAVRGVGALVRHELQPDAKDDCPGDEQRAEQEFAIRAGDDTRPAGSTVGRQRGADGNENNQRRSEHGGAEFDRVRECEGEKLHEGLERRADDGEMLAREATATMGRAMCPPPPPIRCLVAPDATPVPDAMRPKQ